MRPWFGSKWEKRGELNGVNWANLQDSKVEVENGRMFDVV